MKHVDRRKLPAAAREERRRQVIGLRHTPDELDLPFALWLRRDWPAIAARAKAWGGSIV